MKITGWLIETTRLRNWNNHSSVQFFTNLDYQFYRTVLDCCYDKEGEWYITMSFGGSVRTDRQEPGENKLVMVGDQR